MIKITLSTSYLHRLLYLFPGNSDLKVGGFDSGTCTLTSSLGDSSCSQSQEPQPGAHSCLILKPKDPTMKQSGTEEVRGSWNPRPEQAVASHSSTLAWKIPSTEEPGGLQSMGSLRVGDD